MPIRVEIKDQAEGKMQLISFPGGIPVNIESSCIESNQISTLTCRFEFQPSDDFYHHYAVGIYDPEKQKMEIVKVEGIVPLKQILIQQEQKDILDQKQELHIQQERIKKRKNRLETKEEIQGKLSLLSETFGNKKSQKIMRQRMLGKDLDSKATSSVAALDRAVDRIKQNASLSTDKEQAGEEIVKRKTRRQR
jgi:uncharacterized protein YacL (UPF0231 family)